MTVAKGLWQSPNGYGTRQRAMTVAKGLLAVRHLIYSETIVIFEVTHAYVPQRHGHGAVDRAS